MGIRNSAKAIIVENNRLLVIKKQDGDGYYYVLPGGGQEKGENLHEALMRECMEEVNARVKIGELLFIREYIGKNHEHAEFDSELQQTEYMFECMLKENSDEIGNGQIPDDGQMGIEWLLLSELLNYRLYPQTMRKYIIEYFAGEKVPVYLGDVN